MGANLAWFRSKEMWDWGELLLMLEILQNNNMWIIDDKSGSLLASTGDLAYMEPLIIVTASSILDVGRGPGSVSDIFCINY